MIESVRFMSGWVTGIKETIMDLSINMAVISSSGLGGQRSRRHAC
jgi:hypothetical protein